MNWIALFVTALLEFSVIYFIPFMHSRTATILFFLVVLLAGVIIQESREDMPLRRKRIISGILMGTYGTAALMCVLSYEGYLPI